MGFLFLYKTRSRTKLEIVGVSGLKQIFKKKKTEEPRKSELNLEKVKKNNKNIRVIGVTKVYWIFLLYFIYFGIVQFQFGSYLVWFCFFWFGYGSGF